MSPPSTPLAVFVGYGLGQRGVTSSTIQQSSGRRARFSSAPSMAQYLPGSVREPAMTVRWNRSRTEWDGPATTRLLAYTLAMSEREIEDGD